MVENNNTGLANIKLKTISDNLGTAGLYLGGVAVVGGIILVTVSTGGTTAPIAVMVLGEAVGELGVLSIAASTAQECVDLARMVSGDSDVSTSDIVSDGLGALGGAYLGPLIGRFGKSLSSDASTLLANWIGEGWTWKGGDNSGDRGDGTFLTHKK